MKEKVVIAIDLGTTGNRAIAFNKAGRAVAKSYYEFRQIFPKPGWVEHDAKEIYETALKTLSDVISTVGVENVVSIGITNQRETSIIWDKTTGDPLCNAIVWQDRRTEPLCKALQGEKETVKKKTGLFIDPYFSATKIKWMIDNVPAVKKKIDEGKAIFGTPETWILWKLTGGKVHATECSNASRTLIFDINSLTFDQDLLNLFGIPDSILPIVKDSDAEFGVTDKNIVGREIPIVGMLGDQQAALFAHCGWTAGVVKATYGTGIFILRNTLEKPEHLDTLITTVAWRWNGQINYALEGSLFMGGASIQWLRDNFEILKSAPESEPMAASLDSNEGVYFVPAFQGLGAPYWDPRARALLIGLTRKSKRETVVRAVVESLAYQVRDVVEEMKKYHHNTFDVLCVDGGATHNNFLMQFQSDILHVPIVRPKITETTALGAAGISGITTHFWTKEEFKQIREIDKEFHPVMQQEKADQLYAKWREAVKRCMQWSD